MLVIKILLNLLKLDEFSRSWPSDYHNQFLSLGFSSKPKPESNILSETTIIFRQSFWKQKTKFHFFTQVSDTHRT